MRGYIAALCLAGSVSAPVAAQNADAQNNSNIDAEIVVTGSRQSADYYDDDQTVIGLRKQADSAVQNVTIMSDSRDEVTRKAEIHAMLSSAIQRAGNSGVQLVTGDFELAPLTATNYKDLVFSKSNRPDTSQISFYVKSKLAGSTGSAQDRIDNFIKAVPPSGRALMEKQGRLTLTIINPDQYRDEIVRLIAAEAKKNASYFGPEYGVEVGGLNEQLYWSQVSGTEVFLYIPYRFSIRPK